MKNMPKKMPILWMKNKGYKMDLVIIGLMVSGLVAAIQVLSFFDTRNVRKENSLNTYAKNENVKSELTDIRISIDTKLVRLSEMIEEIGHKLDSVDEEISTNSTDVAVLKERINNDREFAKKLEEKLDHILDKL